MNAHIVFMEKSDLLIHTTHLHPFLWHSESLALLYRAGYTSQHIYVPEGFLPPVLPKDVKIEVSSSQIPEDVEKYAGIIRISNFIWMLDTRLMDDLHKRLDTAAPGDWFGIPAPPWSTPAIIGARGRAFHRDQGRTLVHDTYEEDDMVSLFGEGWVGVGGMLDFIVALRDGRDVADTHGNRIRASLLQISFASQPQAMIDRLVALDARWQDKTKSLFRFLQAVNIAP